MPGSRPASEPPGVIESLRDVPGNLQNDAGNQSDASDFLPDSAGDEVVPRESDEAKQGRVETQPGQNETEQGESEREQNDADVRWNNE